MAEGTVSYIVPTIGRASLAMTVASIHLFPGDEILVIGGPQPELSRPVRWFRCPPAGHFGCEERMLGIGQARGSYLAFMDDDDWYLPGARYLMAEALEQHYGRPMLFRLRYPNGFVLWREPQLRQGNVSTQMMLIPNEPAKLGTWTTRREGDFDFLCSMAWTASDVVWCNDVIAQMGHDDYGPS